MRWLPSGIAGRGKDEKLTPFARTFASQMMMVVTMMRITTFAVIVMRAAGNSLVEVQADFAVTRCMGAASYPCLPGMDTMGIGYDAVRGTSFGVGRPVVKLTYSEGDAKVWTDPFGNKTTYSYANEATVTQSTKQLVEFNVF